MFVGAAGAAGLAAVAGRAEARTDPDGTVAELRFYKGETPLGPGPITSASYELTVPNVPSGTYVFSARASDDVGNLTVSSPVSVTVAGQPADLISTVLTPYSAGLYQIAIRLPLPTSRISPSEHG